MLPVYYRLPDGQVCLKPILQLVFEQLYDLGLHEFCIIIGRGKRAIEDHFTQDYSYASYLRNKWRTSSAEDLERFYRRLDNSVISWVTQPEPRGFGDAVLQARKAIGDSAFLVHAGDAYIISRENAYFRRLSAIFGQWGSSIVLLVHELADLSGKGIADVRLRSDGFYDVLSVVEKPKKPKTNLGIEPIYLFQPHIFQVLDRTKPDRSGEIQLTDAIQLMISEGEKVHATALLKEEVRLDVGDPESYWKALSVSHELAKN